MSSDNNTPRPASSSERDAKTGKRVNILPKNPGPMGAAAAVAPSSALEYSEGIVTEETTRKLNELDHLVATDPIAQFYDDDLASCNHAMLLPGQVKDNSRYTTMPSGADSIEDSEIADITICTSTILSAATEALAGYSKLPAGMRIDDTDLASIIESVTALNLASNSHTLGTEVGHLIARAFLKGVAKQKLSTYDQQITQLPSQVGQLVVGYESITKVSTEILKALAKQTDHVTALTRQIDELKAELKQFKSSPSNTVGSLIDYYVKSRDFRAVKPQNQLHAVYTLLYKLTVDRHPELLRPLKAGDLPNASLTFYSFYRSSYPDHHI
ncbi:TPA_asm: hypothetical protein [Metorhabdovirus 2]|nr:TPA_asm: hypothetical protein [Metorhabdovirus 2]